MDSIVVVGGGGHAKVLISVLKKSGFCIAGYTDMNDRGAILEVQYLGNDGILTKLAAKHGGCRAIIGVGKIDASGFRLRLQEDLVKLGFSFPVVVSPQAMVNEEVSLGIGTAAFDGVVINSGAAIGKACILNSSCTIEHDCRIGDNVHIAPGVTLSGGVTIGDNCMIGVGANIIQGVTICNGCLIGAGSTVIRDITIPGVYVGNPAVKIR
jgi:UDP-perosamine 4-acetyltransferase